MVSCLGTWKDIFGDTEVDGKGRGTTSPCGLKLSSGPRNPTGPLGHLCWPALECQVTGKGLTQLINGCDQVRGHKGVQVCIQNAQGVQLGHMVAPDLERRVKGKTMLCPLGQAFRSLESSFGIQVCRHHTVLLPRRPWSRYPRPQEPASY